VLVFAPDGKLVRAWGGPGTGPGQFDFCTSPCDNGGGTIAVGPDGTIVVGEYNNHRIQRFDSSGRFLGQFGRFGHDPGQIINPGVAVDPKGQIWVSDYERDDIQVFSSTGHYMRTIAGPGTGPGQLSGPGQPAFDRDGNLWLADYLNDRFEKFDANGAFVTAYSGDPVHGFAVRQPNSIVVDGQGRLFMVDFDANGLAVTDKDGQLLARFGTTIDSNVNIVGNSLALGANGLVYVVTDNIAPGPSSADRVSVLQLLPPLWP
jgi:tripartite motif-containing protein 71